MASPASKRKTGSGASRIRIICFRSLGLTRRSSPLYQHRTDEWWGCGIDAVSALDCWGMGHPGFTGLKLEPGGPSLKRMGYTPAGYSTTGGSETFHFPGWKRVHCAPARARSRSGFAGRTRRTRYRDGESRLLEAGPGAECCLGFA